MQLISLGLPLAAAGVVSTQPRFSEFLQREEVRHFATWFAVTIVVGQLFWILSLWLASKMMVEKREATLGNAAKIWLLTLLTNVIVGMGLFIGLPIVLKIGVMWRVAMVLCGSGLLMLLFAFLIPMKVYVIGFLRALIVLIITVCLNSLAMSPVEFLLFQSQHLEKDVASIRAASGKTPAEQQKFGQRLFGQEAADEIDRLLDDALLPIGPQPPLPERETLVRNLQQKLAARQHTLKPADVHGRAAYEEQLKRYLSFRDQVAAERRNPPAAH